MKHSIFVNGVLIYLLLSFSSIYAERIAVIDFNAGVGIKQTDVDGISAIFNTYFSPQGYTLVERSRIDRIIEEQKFQRGRLTDQQMVEIGKILNLSQIVVGDVNIVMNQYNVDVRVIDVQSGAILAKDGDTWTPGCSYRTMMRQLATRLADKIAIKQSVSSFSQPIVNNELAMEQDTRDEVVFQVAENMPEFPGGRKALMEYLDENIKYPSIAAENDIQGRVLCQFTVWKDGTIGDIVVVRGIEPSLDSEAIRLIQSMPRWTPGKQHSKAINCRFTLPIMFSLQ